MELSREEVRRPDQMTAGLKKGFEWTTAHSKGVILVAVVALIAGTVFGLWSWVQDSRETDLQEKYYQAERLYMEKKEGFDRFAMSSKTPADPKAKTPAAPEGQKPTGDLTQDYGPAVQGFEDLIQKAPKSRAAGLAALSLSKIYPEYKKSQEAIAALQRAQEAPGVVGALVKIELGTAMANQNDCKGAMDVWSPLLKPSASTFLIPQVKLKMALCAEALGQTAQAEDYYKQVLTDSKDSAVGRSAERYLRILQSGAAAAPHL